MVYTTHKYMGMGCTTMIFIYGRTWCMGNGFLPRLPFFGGVPALDNEAQLFQAKHISIADVQGNDLIYLDCSRFDVRPK